MNFKKIVGFICKAIGLAMGVAVIVLSILKELSTDTAVTLLGIGLFAISLSALIGPGE